MTSPWPQESYLQPGFADAVPGWPDFAQRWLGGEYPTGRGQPAGPQPGWQCPGCTRCFGPAVSQCRFCGPAEDSGTTRDLTWTPDALEPDES